MTKVNEQLSAKYTNPKLKISNDNKTITKTTDDSNARSIFEESIPPTGIHSLTL